MSSASNWRWLYYNPSVNSRTACSRLALQTPDLNGRSGLGGLWGDTQKDPVETRRQSLSCRLDEDGHRRAAFLHINVSLPNLRPTYMPTPAVKAASRKLSVGRNPTLGF